MEKQTGLTEVLPDSEPLVQTTEGLIATRDFVIRGLAYAVPEFINRDTAADLLVAWYPGDQLALASLYRIIGHNRPLQAA